MKGHSCGLGKPGAERGLAPKRLRYGHKKEVRQLLSWLVNMTTIDHATRPALLPFPVETEGRAFQKQESTLILLNLIILSSLLVVELVFEADMGPPSKLVVALFGARFLMQTGELLWLSSSRRPLSPRVGRVYADLSICNHLIFAAAASILSGAEDTHYSVLMILPIVAASFRFSLVATLVTASIAGVLNIVEVWAYFRMHPPGNRGEYFEATAMGLLYLVVGLVVWLLVAQLRRDQARLRATYEELERTRDKLVQEEKLSAIGRLSSAIAHEIRNPIGMISSSLSMGIRESTDEKTRKELFDVAATEAKRLERFTSDFLSYARTAPPRLDRVSVETTLSYVLEISRARAADHTLTVTGNSSQCGEVLGDSFQLHQALLNLIANAIDAADPGTAVTVGCEPVDGHAAIFVENHGSAIEPNVLANIFEPFFTTKPRGTGLGLAIARKIAQAHRGDLILDVNEPGRVRFSLRLPYAEDEARERSTDG